MLHKTLLPGLLAATLLAGPAASTAQEFSGGKAGVDNAFRQRGLQVGDVLPDLGVFDADGKPFNLRSLIGSYTVLVTGCLT
jgi:hypothetical protein